jgi:hypothetical protein
MLPYPNCSLLRRYSIPEFKYVCAFVIARTSKSVIFMDVFFRKPAVVSAAPLPASQSQEEEDDFQEECLQIISLIAMANSQKTCSFLL